VSNVDGKLKEMEFVAGQIDQSIRQAKLEEEHEDMMERLGKTVESDLIILSASSDQRDFGRTTSSTGNDGMLGTDELGEL
jgi:hypothetical protein